MLGKMPLWFYCKCLIGCSLGLKLGMTKICKNVEDDAKDRMWTVCAWLFMNENYRCLHILESVIWLCEGLIFMWFFGFGNGSGCIWFYDMLGLCEGDEERGRDVFPD